jgi:hypothetical protein
MEVKRARHLHDPVAAVGQGATSNGTFDFVDTSQFNTSHSTATPKWSDCIIYGYQDTPLISDTTVNEVAVDNYEAIYRKVTNGVRLSSVRAIHGSGQQSRLHDRRARS